MYKKIISIQTLLDNNRKWAAKVTAANPGFFERNAKGQSPLFFYIGCSDSRIPPEIIMGIKRPGVIFTNRNIANQVDTSDVRASIEYVIKALNVPNIIVCGHEGCGGVGAALADSGPNDAHSDLQQWVDPIRGTRDKLTLDTHDSQTEKVTALSEENVRAQVAMLKNLPIVQQALSDGKLQIHVLMYSLKTGLLRPIPETHP